MIDETHSIQARQVGERDVDTVSFTKYDRRSLSYASTFDHPVKSRVISLIELFTGKFAILRMIRKFEKNGAPVGQGFWRAALDTMGIINCILTGGQSSVSGIIQPISIQFVAQVPKVDERVRPLVSKGGTRSANDEFLSFVAARVGLHGIVRICPC